ncbi:transglycosylase SLT domain-containing protein [Pseudomonas sp. P2757]|uniref:transglycosylase SLT domain-containing protein n=1 Tax=unclassified Pseudomonas TaxID=196821 RepID=UPI003B5A26E0
MTTDYENIKATGTQYDNLIRGAAESEGVRYDLLHKQIYNESSFKSDAKSPTGPLGLAQFTEATGRAYGLMSPEDRLDPVKAVPAMARHMRDLIDKYDGDELTAALAYNQGEGPLGAPQISAMRAGDFSKLSAEGRGYMEKLLDVAVSQHRDAFKSLLTGPAVIPSASLNLVGQPIEKGMSIADMARQQGKPISGDDETGAWDGTWDATKASLKTSVLGAAFRGYSEEGADLGTVMQMMRPVSRMHDNPMTDEDFATLDTLGVKPEYYRQFASAEREEWKHILPVVLDSQEAQKNFDAAGWAAKFTGGLVGLAGDPLTYVPVAGITGSLGARVVKGALYGAATGVASEHLKSRVVGGESDLAMAAAGGAVLGGALSGIFGKNIMVRSGNDAAAHLTPAAENLADPFAGPTVRAEARARAFQEGVQDPTLMPHTDADATVQYSGVNVQEVPFEPGAVRLEGDGIILGESNPLNPKSSERYAKANGGIKTMGFEEIGFTLHSSNSPQVQAIANQLVRSSTGHADGSNGRFAMTASDTMERMRGQINKSREQVSDTADAAMGSKWYTAFSGTRKAAREVLDEKAGKAIEDRSGTRLAALTPEERAYTEAVRDRTKLFEGWASNPAQFGNPNAKPLLASTRHSGHYFARLYDRARKDWYANAMGSREALHEASTEGFMRDYLTDAVRKADIDKFHTDAMVREGLQVTPESLYARVRDQASKDAYGITHGADLHAQVADADGAFRGSADNPFLKGRSMFGTGAEVDTPAGKFSVDSLRSWDVDRILPAYDARMSGDIAIMASTGKTSKELHADIKALSETITPKEREALDQVMKIFTGTARRDGKDGIGVEAIRTLTDSAFLGKNAYMAFQNFLEVVGLARRGYVGMLAHNVPGFRDMSSAKYRMTAKDLDAFHGSVFGRELDNSIAPRRGDIEQRLTENGTGAFAAKAMSWVRTVPQTVARHSPFTTALTETTNYLLDAGRKGILGDIVRHTLAGGKSPFDRMFTSEESMLRSASITPAQWDGIKALIGEHMEKAGDGTYRVRDHQALQADPRSNDLYRLGDRLADEIMIRPHKVSNLDTKAYGPFVKMLMQFKSFTIKSLNQRLMRGVHEARLNDRVLDQSLTAALSVMLSGAGYAAQAHAKAFGMAESDRKRYLEDALTPGMLAYASVSRSAYVGALPSVANMIAAPAGFDQAAMVRTSILPETARKKDKGITPILYGMGGGDTFEEILKQVPAAGIVSNAGKVAVNALGLAQTVNDPDKALLFRTGLYKAGRNFVPNDPVSQRATAELFEMWGIDTTK